MLDTIAEFIYAAVRIATPVIFISICSAISQQAGLLNMVGETMMLTASLMGVLFSAWCHNVWLGILGGALSAVLIVVLLCAAAFIMKIDLYLMSISLNMAIGGATVFVIFLLSGGKASTTGVVDSLTLGNWSLPLIEKIPFVGKALSGHNGFTYIAIAMTFAVWFLLYKTKLGLRIRAVGQNPKAAESVGIDTRKIQTVAFAVASFVGAFGGMYLSMGYQNFFIRNITGGRGFLGVASSTIANAQPFGSALISIIIGFAYSFNNTLKTVFHESNVLLAIPYLLIVVIYFTLSGVRAAQTRRRQAEIKKNYESRIGLSESGGVQKQVPEPILKG